jgi:hypothetical protein
VEVTAWSKDLTVEVAGHGVVSHAGSAVVRVLADTAVLIADGGRVLSDLATLRDQGELFGPVASDPTLWRTLSEIGPTQRNRITRARAKTRAHVWKLIEARHGRIPLSRVGDRDLGRPL